MRSFFIQRGGENPVKKMNQTTMRRLISIGMLAVLVILFTILAGAGKGKFLHFDNLIESSAKAISNIKFDKVVVWDGTGKDGQTATGNWLTGMAKTLPPMLEVMKEVAGVDILPSITGAENKEAAPAEAPAPAEK